MAEIGIENRKAFLGHPTTPNLGSSGVALVVAINVFSGLCVRPVSQPEPLAKNHKAPGGVKARPGALLLGADYPCPPLIAT